MNPVFVEHIEFTPDPAHEGPHDLNAVRNPVFTLARHRNLALENLALRQQIAVLQRSVKRPRLSKRDRIFWVVPSRIWTGWSEVLTIVKPETVIRWHRRGFRLYEDQLRRILRDYFAYYCSCRTDLSLEKDSPFPRKVESPDQGKIVECPMVGGPRMLVAESLKGPGSSSW